MPEIYVQEVKQKIDRKEDFLILDVREPWEREIAQINGALFIPMNSVQSRLTELDPSKEIVIHCRTGQRSAIVTQNLIKEGYSKVKNMVGGINAWTTEVDPKLILY